MYMGKLAVVMTVYNEKINYLSKAVESTLLSLGKVDESKLIIYVDNYNNALESEVIGYLNELKLDSVLIIFSNSNMGLAESLNYVINKYCLGFEYIGRMDADDICHVDRFSKQICELVDRDIDVIGCNGEKIDEDGELIGSIRNKKYPTFLYGNEMIHPSLIFRRTVFEKLFGYRAYSSAQDYDFLCRAKASDFKIMNLQSSLIHYRIREGAIGQIRKKEQLLYKIGISEGFRKGTILSEPVTLSEGYKYYDIVEKLKLINLVMYRFMSLFSALHIKKYMLVILRRLELSRIK